METSGKSSEEQALKKLTVDEIAAGMRQQALIARMKAFSARVKEQAQTAADTTEFQDLMDENARLEGELLALRIARAELRLRK